ncbi:MAG: hypothetical protein FRX49_00320 [Trebouxia sp. A1-2]|nr:MAG: hypothetical protein FRX49_00320 [Trebouxia sp. A1-2]
MPGSCEWGLGSINQGGDGEGINDGGCILGMATAYRLDGYELITTMTFLAYQLHALDRHVMQKEADAAWGVQGSWQAGMRHAEQQAQRTVMAVSAASQAVDMMLLQTLVLFLRASSSKSQAFTEVEFNLVYFTGLRSTFISRAVALIGLDTPGLGTGGQGSADACEKGEIEWKQY